ncbi:SAF domain-containing protein [Nocardioides sp. PD653]|uniref:SAF domain-containing protein n=2 Tax=unclassified Nocardioides TaxID=2615069 RepID=UPI0009F0FD7D|nr:SAF domain-containing protein [Nocardioides sp. PD653]GAW55587.1 SAF domain-containing protein [Nocardioides sp. PD653]
MTSLDSRTSRRATNNRRANTGLPGLPGTASLSKAVSKAPRKYGQMLVTVLVVIAAVIAGGYLYVHKDNASEVLVVARPIPAGHPITEADVRTTKDPMLVSRTVSGVDGAIPVADVGSVFGKRTTVALVPGQVLTDDALTTSLLPQPGQQLIAVSIPAGRVPATLKAGSVVNVIEVPQSGQAGDPTQLSKPQDLASGATVYDVGDSQGGNTTVTLLIDDADAKIVAAYGSVGQLTLLQAPVTDGDAALTPTPSSDATSSPAGDPGSASGGQN